MSGGRGDCTCTGSPIQPPQCNSLANFSAQLVCGPLQGPDFRTDYIAEVVCGPLQGPEFRTDYIAQVVCGPLQGPN